MGKIEAILFLSSNYFFFYTHQNCILPLYFVGGTRIESKIGELVRFFFEKKFNANYNCTYTHAYIFINLRICTYLLLLMFRALIPSPQNLRMC